MNLFGVIFRSFVKNLPYTYSKCHKLKTGRWILLPYLASINENKQTNKQTYKTNKQNKRKQNETVKTLGKTCNQCQAQETHKSKVTTVFVFFFLISWQKQHLTLFWVVKSPYANGLSQLQNSVNTNKLPLYFIKRKSKLLLAASVIKNVLSLKLTCLGRIL